MDSILETIGNIIGFCIVMSMLFLQIAVPIAIVVIAYVLVTG